MYYFTGGFGDLASRATEVLGKFAANEKIQVSVANLALAGSVWMSAQALLEDGRPSEGERREIYACSAQLSDAPKTTYSFSFPVECESFRNDFPQTYTSQTVRYTLPSERNFHDHYLWKNTIEEDRNRDFKNSGILLSASLALYGIVSFRRRLDNPSGELLAEEVERYLRFHSDKK